MQKDKAVMDYIGKVIDSDLKLKNEMLTGTRKEYLVTLPGATEPTLNATYFSSSRYVSKPVRFWILTITVLR